MSLLTTKIKALIDKVRNKELDEDLLAGKIDELSDLIDEVAEDEEAAALPDLEDLQPTKEAEPAAPPAPAPPVIPNFVELEWDQIVKIKALQQSLKNTRERLGVSVIAHMKEKDLLVKNIENTEEAIVSEINRMREEHGLPEDIDYVLNLPASAGEKGSFQRSDLN